MWWRCARLCVVPLPLIFPRPVKILVLQTMQVVDARLCLVLPTRTPRPPLERVSKDLLWNQHEVSLLAKVTDANMVKDFRPIAVLPVIYNLYRRVMYMLTETTCIHLVSARFAFRKYHQAHEVVFILRQLVEQSG